LQASTTYPQYYTTFEWMCKKSLQLVLKKQLLKSLEG